MNEHGLSNSTENHQTLFLMTAMFPTIGKYGLYISFYFILTNLLFYKRPVLSGLSQTTKPILKQTRCNLIYKKLSLSILLSLYLFQNFFRSNTPNKSPT